MSRCCCRQRNQVGDTTPPTSTAPSTSQTPSTKLLVRFFGSYSDKESKKTVYNIRNFLKLLVSLLTKEDCILKLETDNPNVFDLLSHLKKTDVPENKSDNIKIDHATDNTLDEFPKCIVLCNTSISEIERIEKNDDQAIIVLKGSGGLSDYLSYAQDNINIIDLEENIRKNLKSSEMTEEEKKRLAEFIKRRFDCQRSFEIVNINKKLNQKMISEALLKALSEVYGDDLEKFASLCIRLNNLEVAVQYGHFFKIAEKEHYKSLQNIMSFAFELNRLDFIRYLVEQGLDIVDIIKKENQGQTRTNAERGIYKEYCENRVIEFTKTIKIDMNVSNIDFTDKRSSSYSSLKSNVTDGLLHKFKNAPGFSNVTVTDMRPGSLYVDYTVKAKPTLSSQTEESMNSEIASNPKINVGGQLVSMSTGEDDNKIEEIRNKCFTEAIFHKNFDLAFIVWRNIQSPTIAALYAIEMITKMKSLAVKDELEKLNNQIKNYELHAIHTLNKTYEAWKNTWKNTGQKQSEDDIFRLLMTKNRQWKNFFCIELAIKNDLCLFLSQVPCTMYNEKIWKKSQITFKNDEAIGNCSRQRISYPRIVAILKFVSHTVFLIMYAVWLVSFLEAKTFHWLEWIIWLWIVCNIWEFLYQCLRNPLRKSKSCWSPFNIMEIPALAFFLISWSLRMVAFVYHENTDLMEWTMILFSINFSIFAVMLLEYCYTMRFLGPKIITVMKMMQILLPFLLFILPFFFAFAITSQAVLHTNSTSEPLLALDIFKRPFFSIYGEMLLDDLDKSTTGSYFVTVWMGIYLVIVNTLLINLLIALFNADISNVEKNSEELWNYQTLVFTFQLSKTIIVPPFFFLFNPRYCCHKDDDSFQPLSKEVNFKDEPILKKLRFIESEQRNLYLNEMEYKRLETQPPQAELTDTIDSFIQPQENPEQDTKRIDELEKKVNRTEAELSRIEDLIKSMTDLGLKKIVYENKNNISEVLTRMDKTETETNKKILKFQSQLSEVKTRVEENYTATINKISKIQSQLSGVQTRMDQTDTKTKNNFSNIQSQLSGVQTRMDETDTETKNNFSKIQSQLSAVQTRMDETYTETTNHISKIQSQLIGVQTRMDENDTETKNNFSNIQSQLSGVQTRMDETYTQTINNISKIQSQLSGVQTRMDETDTEIKNNFSNIEIQLSGVQTRMDETDIETKNNFSNIQSQLSGVQTRMDVTDTETKNIFFKIQSQLSGVQTRMEETYTETINNFSKILSQLSGVQTRMDQTVTETKNNVSKIQSHLSGVQTRMDQTDTETKNNFFKIQSQLSGAQTRMDQTETECKNNFSKIQSQLSGVQTRMDQTVTETKNNFSNIQSQVSGVQNRMDKTDTETKNLKAEIRRNISGVQTRMDKTDTETKNLFSEIQSNVSKVQTRMNKTDAETKNNFSNIQSKLSRAVQRIRQKEIKIKSLMSEVKRIEKKFDLQWTYLVGKNTTVHNPPKPDGPVRAYPVPPTASLMLDQLEKKAARNYIAYPYRLDWHIQGSDKPRKKGIEKKEFNQSSKNSKASST